LSSLLFSCLLCFFLVSSFFSFFFSLTGILKDAWNDVGSGSVRLYLGETIELIKGSMSSASWTTKQQVSSKHHHTYLLSSPFLAPNFFFANKFKAVLHTQFSKFTFANRRARNFHFKNDFFLFVSKSPITIPRKKKNYNNLRLLIYLYFRQDKR
jgi:hypothetical protein